MNKVSLTQYEIEFIENFIFIFDIFACNIKTCFIQYVNYKGVRTIFGAFNTKYLIQINYSASSREDMK